MDINQILSSVLASTNASNARLLDIANMQGQVAQQGQAVNAANTAQAQADIPQAQALATQTADVEAQRSQMIQMLQAQANLNPADADNAYVKGLADLTATNLQREAAHAELTKLATTNLLDDPIGYVMAQINLPVAQAQAQSLDQQAQRQIADVDARLKLVASAKSTLTADTVQQVKDIQLGQAALAAREASRKLSQQEVENAGRIAGQYLQQANTLDKINDNTRQVFSMQLNAAQFQATMEERALLRAERTARLAEAAKEKKLKEEEDAMLQGGLAAASKILGFPQPVSVEFFKRMPNSRQKQRLAELAANNSLGDTLFDSVVAFDEGGGTIAGLQRGGNVGFSKFMSGIDKTTDFYISDARRTPDKLGKTPSEKEANVIGVQNYEKALVASASDPKAPRPLTSPQWDSQFNPYRQHFGLLSNAVTAGKVPALTGNPVYEAMKNVATLSTTPDGNISGEGEQTALRTVAQLVADRKLNENDAAKAIVQYYRTTAAVNKDFYQYTLAGLPTQDSYMARVKIPGLLGDSTTKGYNLMNETQAKMLMMEIAKQGARNAPVGMATMPTGEMFKWAR
jgi:hypothetical protein